MTARTKTTSCIIVSPETMGQEHHLEKLLETEKLARSLNIEPFFVVKFKLKNINRKHLVSKQILDYLKYSAAELNFPLLIFTCELSASWQREIEKYLCSKVIDRTELILDIFSDRARSHEGKLQVKLAQLNHMATRLVKIWTHLERQKGGIGLRGGPGEKQIETDRRIIRENINRIQKRLAKVKKTRQQNRSYRKRNNVPVVALVGYTNVGKSTLFNLLTKKNILVKNMPFASLDTTTGKVYLNNSNSCILVDTVGFIEELPKELISAFRSTLEELNDADLILHVLDATDENLSYRRNCVNETLAQILTKQIPILEVYNKSELSSTTVGARQIKISALEQLGIENLKENIASSLNQH
ncbi:MAG: GTPase HflX [Pseudomonadota bacterium]|nr:GTPase HflX [Pseudomonadota bacterium]